MDVNYRANVAKWLPLPASDHEQWITNAFKLSETMKKVIGYIALLIENGTKAKEKDKKKFYGIIHYLEDIMADYKRLLRSSAMHSAHPVYKYRVNCLITRLKRNLNIVAKFARNLIHDIIDYHTNDILYIIFRLINIYNNIIDVDRDVSDSTVNVYCNDCPNMLEPLKKFSVTRVLQILAKNRAEVFCHQLIDCLLANYQPREKDCHSSGESIDCENSENSSIEIYRALTRHLSPPAECTASTSQEETTSTETLQTLVNEQNEQVLRMINVIHDVSPRLLGNDAVKTMNGETKLRSRALKMVKNYYEEVAWGALSEIVDHVILWWSAEAIATHHSRGAQHLKEWLRQFVHGNVLPPAVRSALQSLCDALGYHTTITIWDHLFRLAYTSSFDCHSKPSTSEGTDTGQMFIQVIQLLVGLSNECEVGGEWVVGAPLMELPLSEQIVVLHRLDHSVHTCRLWAILQAKIIANTWLLEVFFLLVKGDIVNFIEELSYRKLTDHSSVLSMENVSVQVYVCARMRAKIVSEVNTNIQLLQETPAKCIDILAKICRVVCLANLHMCFPRSNYWRKTSDVAPVSASTYVETYFEKVLLPVLEVMEDHETSNMVLRIMCESWLDYIYSHRIKFSEYGALQLLTDFAYVSTWVTECAIISQNVKSHLLKNEVLRRCEGVGKLLLRRPGESIAMRKKLNRRTNESGSPESLGLERMPAEMYVPNQEQWLELRASKRYNFFCTE